METIIEENTIVSDANGVYDLQQQPQPQKSEQKKINVIFCIPGREFSNNFLISWSELFAYCFTNNINPYLSTAYDSNVFFVRNKCLGGNIMNGISQKPFQGSIEYDYIMWIDSDQVFNVEMFKRLMSHDKDIVSGMYLMNDMQHFAVVTSMDNNYLIKNGSYEFLSREKLQEMKQKQKEENTSSLISVSYCGMGFMLIKHGVLEKLSYPWFKPTTTTIQDTSGNIVIQDYNSEDFYLSVALRKLGYEIFVDTDIIVGHEKKIVM